MQLNFDTINKINPLFTHYVFSDNDRRLFIEQHFDTTVLHAYDSLIPGAYKADLWRYCVLYINGGIYLDSHLMYYGIICLNHYL